MDHLAPVQSLPGKHFLAHSIFIFQQFLTVLADSISYVGGVAFGKDIGPLRTPLSTSSRFVSYVYSFLALIMINSYCANLMAFLVEEKVSLPITGVHDPKVSVHECMNGNVQNNFGTLPD